MIMNSHSLYHKILLLFVCSSLMPFLCNCSNKNTSSNSPEPTSESIEGVYVTQTYIFNTFDDYLEFYEIYKEHNIARFLMPKFDSNFVITIHFWHVSPEDSGRTDINFGDNEGWYTLNFDLYDSSNQIVFESTLRSVGYDKDFTSIHHEKSQNGKEVFYLFDGTAILSGSFKFNVTIEDKELYLSQVLENLYLGVDYVY